MMQTLLQRLDTDRISDIPERIMALNRNELSGIGAEYLARLAETAPDAKYVTDKMPHNFLLAGVIKTVLPNARIIHTVRSAKDTCLSIFRTKFVTAHEYAYDLQELGRYYLLYADLMAHWRQFFDRGIYDVHYEKLTADLEGETRRLLEFCGLPWDEGCLKFHDSARDVQTASNTQVRKPVYRSSVGAWKRYERELQPLIEALESA